MCGIYFSCISEALLGASPQLCQLSCQDEVNASDWVKRNRAYKRNAAAWADSKPAHRLAILKQAMMPMATLMHRALRLASKEWCDEQELKTARGEARSFRLLEAARQEDLKEYFTNMLLLLLQPLKGVPFVQLTASLRIRMFRVVARGVCSMHQLLRLGRRAFPYQLFHALETGEYSEASPCLFDEFTQAFKTWHPNFDEEAGVCLEAVAEAVDLEIAAIEARHALSRRLVVSKGVQAWVPHLANTSAEWSVRQIILRESEVRPRAVDKPVARPLKRQPGKQEGARGGGGGPWKAFLHERAAGRKICKSVAKQLSDEYNNLTAEEMSYFQLLGRDGTTAWRHGFHAFGERQDRSESSHKLKPQLLIGDVLDSGAIVAADINRGPLQTNSARDFAYDMRDIRRKFRNLRQRCIAQQLRNYEFLQQVRQTATEAAPVPHAELSAQQYGCAASPGARKISATVRWYPPCIKFAKAPGSTIAPVQLSFV